MARGRHCGQRVRDTPLFREQSGDVVITKKVYLCPVKPKRNQAFPQQKTAQMTNYQRYNSQSYDYGGYRYFFNGQESDAEAYGQGGLAGYEFRQYDTRL